jgi:glycosyltransferase involved in cell wall biosynthesis
MKVSVILPVFNEEEYIAKCLTSLSNQQEPADEVIVVNNNSTDHTIEIAKRFGVRIVKESKQGISYARNRGFNVAKFDILARIDADSILPTNWIKKIKHNFSKYKIDALTGPVIFFDFPFKTPAYAQMYLELFKYIQKGKDTLIGPNMAMTKKIWKKIEKDVCMDNAKVHEDIDLAIHLVQAGGKIRTDDTLIAHCSARRLLRHPQSFFVEYPIRLVNTLKTHNNTIYHQ